MATRRKKIKVPKGAVEMIWQEDKEFKQTGDALLDACSKASCNAIVCLWIRSEKDPSRLRLIAKFY